MIHLEKLWNFHYRFHPRFQSPSWKKMQLYGYKNNLVHLEIGICMYIYVFVHDSFFFMYYFLNETLYVERHHVNHNPA